ncbi:hypothetical protein BKA62DRAFT_776097 [Auriculariales sp. MPI-PUGE-AT-0066]|nr:hypothetical protein BKA62DRAFT_776097 [Auriculariales sp. MPI-PUGE-AT-0066]
MSSSSLQPLANLVSLFRASNHAFIRVLAPNGKSCFNTLAAFGLPAVSASDLVCVRHARAGLVIHALAFEELLAAPHSGDAMAVDSTASIDSAAGPLIECLTILAVHGTVEDAKSRLANAPTPALPPGSESSDVAFSAYFIRECDG